MDSLRPKSAAIREKRLQAISAFYGKAETLLQEHADVQFTQRVRTFSQDVSSDIIKALEIISTIRNSAIVVHGTAGCAVARLSQQIFDENDSHWAITNLNERDSIMGSDVELREGIRQVFKLHSPEIVFIVSTPVVAINNDDIESVVEELKEELGIAIVPVYADGFRSKIGSTGYDLVSHSIVKHVLPLKKADVSDYVNLLSISEKPNDLNEIYRLLNELGLRTNLFPRSTSLENIKRIRNAAFSISINPDEADYPGTVLQERYEIPFVQPVIPIGIENTSQWLANIALATGHESQARNLISREKAQLTQLLEQRAPEKKKVFISLQPAIAFGIANLLEELGIEVIGLKLTYVDKHHVANLEKLKADQPEFAFLVGEGQLFEEENLIRKLNPEIYIGDSGDFAVAIRSGIPVINLESIPVFGFSGVKNLITKIRKALSNNSFTKISAQNEAKTYTGEWLKKSPNWFIKQEVK